MKIKLIFCFFLSILLITSCQNKNTITIISYNAQTFFDLINDGREFEQFKKSKNKWNEKDYDKRLNRLLEAIKICSNELKDTEDTPDLLVLQEIESEEVIKDIAKRLNQTNCYKECVFLSPCDGLAFNTAIFSKYKILNAKAHNIYSKDNPLRPIIEANILINLYGKDINITLFGVHWKSKKTNGFSLRAMQEILLYNKMKEKEKFSDYVIACGDFNQNDFEFSKMKSFNNAWKLYKECNEKSINECEEDEALGSYCYKGKWERLDHIFYLQNPNSKHCLEVSKFILCAKAPLVLDGKINRYNIGTKQGYSDHLPIGLLLTLSN